MVGNAIFSPGRTYRYKLERTWHNGILPLVFVMLNPSVADAYYSDATVTRCLARALAWGFGGLEVYNMFAYISTDARQLLKVADPVGPENDAYISLIPRDRTVIVAWGQTITKMERFRKRDEEVMRLLNRTVYCLRAPKGFPEHPLYVPYKLVPVVYRLNEIPNQASLQTMPVP